MSFFNIFKGKSKGPVLRDEIYMHKAAKDKAVIKIKSKAKPSIFLVWSDVSYEHYQKLLGSSVQLIQDSIPSRLSENEIVFLEHHFNNKKEMDFIKSLNLKEALFISSLDDPIFALFNSHKIKEVMKKMNHDEDDAIEHKMISKSIIKAQDKLSNLGLPADCEEDLISWYNSLI